MQWSEKDIEFLKQNYPNKGLDWCSNKLKRTKGSIRAKASQLKIYQNRNSEFFKEWQSRAKESKIGKKRPEHSKLMSRYYKEGKLTALKDKLSDKEKQIISLRTKKWIKENGHPRGFLNGNHTDEVKKILSVSMKKMWNDENSYVNSDEYRQIVSDRQSKIMNERLKSSTGNVYSRCKKGKIDIGGKNIFARSSWEANIAAYFEFLKTNNEILDWEHEPKTFWFESIKRGVRSYMPDFKIYKNDGSYYWVEVKGWMDAKSKTKLKRMKKYYPEEKLELIDSKRYNQIKKQSSIIPNWGLLD